VPRHPSFVDLCLHLINVVRSHFAAQPNPLSAFTRFARNLLDLQRHVFYGSEAHFCECNDWAILNSLMKCDLGLLPILNFEEFP
jgi:hypothetical protein